MLAVFLAAVSVGQPAPPIALPNLPPLKGRAAVIEFWAPWCGPCVEHIPTWNALVERYRDFPIQFVAISVEEPGEDMTPMAGWTALDPYSRVFHAWGVDSVPRTILVDAKGVVRGVTTVAQLTDADFEAVLAGRNIGPAVRPASPG